MPVAPTYLLTSLNMTSGFSLKFEACVEFSQTNCSSRMDPTARPPRKAGSAHLAPSQGPALPYTRPTEVSQ